MTGRLNQVFTMMKFLPFILFTVLTNAAAQLMLKYGMMQLGPLSFAGVNPLLKIIHTPTMQGRLIEAASNLKGMAPGFEALIFSIYSMAVLSLSPAVCVSLLGSAKDELLTKYQFACQEALYNARYLYSSDIDTLIALHHHLVS